MGEAFRKTLVQCSLFRHEPVSIRRTIHPGHVQWSSCSLMKAHSVCVCVGRRRMMVERTGILGKIYIIRCQSPYLLCLFIHSFPLFVQREKGKLIANWNANYGIKSTTERRMSAMHCLSIYHHHQRSINCSTPIRFFLPLLLIIHFLPQSILIGSLVGNNSN